MKQITLKPCPFCGGPAKMISNIRHGQEYATASCEKIDCQGVSSMAPPQSKAVAAALWNRRAH